MKHIHHIRVPYKINKMAYPKKTHMYIYMYIYMYTYIYMYIYIHIELGFVMLINPLSNLLFVP